MEAFQYNYDESIILTANLFNLGFMFVTTVLSGLALNYINHDTVPTGSYIYIYIYIIIIIIITT